jgi:hypothetical protein
MIDLRQRWTPQRLTQLIEEMSRAEVVRADYGKGPGGVVLKGKKLLKKFAAGHSAARQVTMVLVTVANTTQAELLMAALTLHEQGRFHDAQAANCAKMLEIAAAVPGGHHDDVAFQAAMARAKGKHVGST